MASPGVNILRGEFGDMLREESRLTTFLFQERLDSLNE
jgi:hypothetical protein